MNHRDRFLIPFHTSVQFIYERVRKPVTLVLGIQVHVYSLCMIKTSVFDVYCTWNQKPVPPIPWDGYEFEYFKDYPSVKWKLLNLEKLAKLNPQKLQEEVEHLNVAIL